MTRRVEILGGKPSRPSLNLSFLNGALDSRLSFARASGGTYFDPTGTLQTAANNVPRFDYGAQQTATNYVPNSINTGASVGTPGILPTGWSNISGTASLSRQIVGMGVQGTFPYIDIRYSGTTDSTGQFSVDFASGQSAAASQAWSESVSLALVGGSLTNFPIQLRIAQRNSAGSGLSQFFGPITPTAVLTRYTLSTTFTSDATTASVSTGIFVILPVGVAVDVTLRFAAPQLEQSAIVNSWVPTSNAAATGVIFPVGRTNWVPNSTMAGATIGAVGASNLVPGQSLSVGAGLTAQLVGTGIQGGVATADFRVFGTATTAGQLVFNYVATTAVVPASLGQLWNFATDFQVLSDLSDSPQTSFSLVLAQVGGAGGYLTKTFSQFSTFARQSSGALTLTNTSVTGIQASVWPGATVAGQHYDITFRIGAPQLENWWTATAFIPTSGVVGNVGAACNGVWIEPQATNSIQNPRYEGGGFGTGNSAVLSSGLSWTVNGVFVENGIPCCEMNLSGTTTIANSAPYLQYGGTGQIAAASGQVWNWSHCLRLVGSSALPSGASLYINLLDLNSSNSQINATSLNIAASITNAPIGTQRFSQGHLCVANTATVLPRLFFNFPTLGTVVNITFRLALAQLEICPGITSAANAIPTTPILPVAGTPAVTTRGGDVCTMVAGSWFNGSAGTLWAEALSNYILVPTGNSRVLAQLADSAAGTNLIQVRHNISDSALAGSLNHNNATVISVAAGAGLVAGQPVRGAVSYSTQSPAQFAAQGVLGTPPGAKISSPMPAGMLLTIGHDFTGAIQTRLSALVRGVKYWPRSMGTTEQTGITN